MGDALKLHAGVRSSHCVYDEVWRREVSKFTGVTNVLHNNLDQLADLNVIWTAK